MATKKTREKIVSAFLTLVAENGWHGFDMADLAAGAGVKLSVLRAEFPTKLSCFKAFLSEIDQTVLDGIDAEMADEPGRDRLFDVLMSRLDALAPHRDAIRALKDAARADPQLALRLNSAAVVSQRWMLTAAGLPASGARAGVIAQGLVVAFARVVDVWLGDEDPGLARTMSALDKELDEGEVWLGRLDRIGKMMNPLFSGLRRRAARKEAAGDDARASHDDDGTSPASA